MPEYTKPALPDPNQEQRYLCAKCGYYGTSGSYIHPNDEGATCGHFPQVLGPWWIEEQMQTYADACVAAALAHVRAEQAPNVVRAEQGTVAIPEGYEPHELPADYTGKLWIEGQVRAVARTSPVHRPYIGWTDADADAARLALELECLLTDKDVPMPALSRWWDSAHEALELHRKRMAEPQPVSGAADPVGQPAGEQTGPVSAAPTLTDIEIWMLVGDKLDDSMVKLKDVLPIARAIEAAIRVKVKA